ncbi:MAG TPA: zinc-binding dehydrogenase, partial [Pyrinomonadaceae bacterium]|nr:zinc-binding dehydrogenase [Pyrinomonadaceae bacterium]
LWEVDVSDKTIPAKMRALELRDYEGQPESVAVVEKEVPQPRAGEVLVRVAASPVNPSDLAFLKGVYGLKKRLPVVPGFEGAGEVVASGGGLLARFLNGRRVACAAAADADGTWAEYMRTDAKLCIPLRKEVETEQAAAMIVNPFTAWALLEKAEGRGGVVQSAAASALGRMINKLALSRGVELVNVVRRDEQAELLRSEGARHVLNSNAEDFDERLRDLCKRLDVGLALDAVAGELTGKLLGALRKGGKAVVYGALSFEACHADPRALIFEGKTVEGFWLTEWLREQGTLQLLRTASRVQKMLGGELKTEVRARLPLEEAARGIAEYAENMTGGKILLVPSLRAGAI